MLPSRLDEAEDAFGKAAWNGRWQGPAVYALAQFRGRAGDLDGALRGARRRRSRPTHDTRSARVLQAALLRRTGDLEAAGLDADAALADDPLDRWMLEERRRDERASPLAATTHRPARRRQPALRPSGVQTPSMSPTITPPPASCRRPSTSSRRAEPRAGDRVDPLVPTRSAGCSTRRATRTPPSTWYERGRGCHRTAASRPASRRSRSSRPRRRRTLVTPARRTTSATCSTTAAGTTTRSRPGGARVGSTRPSRPSTATSASPSTTSGTDRSPPGVVPARVRRRPDRRPRPLRVRPVAQAPERAAGAPAGEARGHRDLVDARDDLGVEYATLLDQLDRPADALAYLVGRRFHPWEGGEGVALGAYVAVRVRLARAPSTRVPSRPPSATSRPPSMPPRSLGEARHPLAPDHEIRYELGRRSQRPRRRRRRARGVDASPPEPLPDGIRPRRGELLPRSGAASARSRGGCRVRVHRVAPGGARARP